MSDWRFWQSGSNNISWFKVQFLAQTSKNQGQTDTTLQ